MTAQQLRGVISAHIRQPTHKRNRAHVVTAIYLGRDEWLSLLDEDRLKSGSPIHLEDGGITFDGVPLYVVDERSHVRIVSEHVES